MAYTNIVLYKKKKLKKYSRKDITIYMNTDGHIDTFPLKLAT